MQWAPEQDAALSAVSDWMTDRGSQVFRLFGYAGTGKTTLARHFAEGIDGTVMFGAYTGKAAHVLRQKGCTGASTIHSMIYTSREKGRSRLLQLEQELAELRAELRKELSPDTLNSGDEVDGHPAVNKLKAMIKEERSALARPMFNLNPASTIRDAKLIVIDECSMVDAQMGEDLLSFGVKVLVLGDPAQLPPVGGGGFFTEQSPDVMLTDIHRQARESPIIHLATKARNKQAIDLGTYGACRVIGKASPELALAADQILVGRNNTRRSSNNRVRALKGFGEDFPIHDDRIVCLRNNHDHGLLNGAIWYVDGAVEHVNEDRILMNIVSEDDRSQFLVVQAHLQHFQGREDDLMWWERKEAEEFTYGYALTVHKSQGSQWNNVLLFDEAHCFRQDKWRWLYTGITRAAETLTIVQT
jgi:exodeoxyribonuclease-5